MDEGGGLHSTPRRRLARIALILYIDFMPPTTHELIEICGRLPEEKLRSLVDYARFLEAQSHEDSEMDTGDDAWERIIADRRQRPELDAFVKESLGEGNAEPLDLDKL